jgi:hypothetical protein
LGQILGNFGGFAQVQWKGGEGKGIRRKDKWDFPVKTMPKKGTFWRFLGANSGKKGIFGREFPANC